MSILVLSKYDKQDINGYNLVFNEYLADAQLIFFYKTPHSGAIWWHIQMGRTNKTPLKYTQPIFTPIWMVFTIGLTYHFLNSQDLL